MNAEALAAPLVQALKGIETTSAESRSFTVLKLSTQLGLREELASKAANRKDRYSMESLGVEGTRLEARRALTQFLHCCAQQITDSPEAAKLLADECARHMQPHKIDHGERPLRVLADAFVRSIGQDQRVLERERFALLYEATNGRNLQSIVEDAVVRALADNDFMSTARGRKYAKRIIPASSPEQPQTNITTIDQDDEGLPTDLGDLSEELLPAECMDIEQASAAPALSSSLTAGGTANFPKIRKSVSVFLSVTGQLRMKVRWARSPVRKARAVDDYKTITLGNALPKIWSCPRVGLESIRNGLRFLEDISQGWKGGATQTVSVGESRIKDMPCLSMSLPKMDAWKEYQTLAKDDAQGSVYGSKPLGYESFSTLYDGLSKLIEEKHALSYYFTGAQEAMAALVMLTKRMRVLWDLHHNPAAAAETFKEFDNLPCKFDALLKAIDECTHHLKYGIRSHLLRDTCDGCALHCARYAVGTPCGQAVHLSGECVECNNFVKLPDAVRALMNAVMNSLARENPGNAAFLKTAENGPVKELDSMASAITACMRSLNYYHKHVVRGLWQGAAVSEILKNLQPGEVLVTIDHKQKIEQVNFNESSADYYGKKGMSLLGVAARYRLQEGGPIYTKFIDTICLNSKQDGAQVQAILSVVIPVIKELISSTVRIILLSDNGAVFTSKDNMKFVWRKNLQNWDVGVKVVRWVFFEAQCGKTILDTHFAYVGILIKRFARKVRAVKQHQDVFDALKDGGGIANTTTLLVNIPGASEDDGAAATEAESDSVAISGIRKVHDIAFAELVKTFMFSGVARGGESYDFSKETMPLPKAANVIQCYTSDRVAEPSALRVAGAAHGQVASSSSASAGPQTRCAQLVSPHERRMMGEMIDFATQSQQTAPVPLLPSPSVAVAVAANPSSQKKKSTVETDDFRLEFPSSWADAVNRKSAVMNLAMVAELHTLVRSFAHCTRIH
jgi:hypothetical protein